MVNTSRIVFTIALAAEEDGVASTAIRPLDLPISHSQPSENKGAGGIKEGSLVLQLRLAGAIHAPGDTETFTEEITTCDLTDRP